MIKGFKFFFICKVVLKTSITKYQYKLSNENFIISDVEVKAILILIFIKSGRIKIECLNHKSY